MPAQDEQKLAILIGVDTYLNGIPPLRGAVRDVRAVADILRNLHGYETRCLLDKEATADSIRRLLEQLKGEITNRHRVVFYFAGHGIAESIQQEDGKDEAASTEPQGLLLPHDANPKQPASFLRMSALQEMLAKLSCHHLFIILDCCFAGAFRWQRTRSLDVQLGSILFKEQYDRYLRDPARQVLTSCAHDERALDLVQRSSVFAERREVDGGSPFAQALCEGLRGHADLSLGKSPPDGVIVPSELYLYIDAALAGLEAQLQQPMQRPMLFSLEGHEKGQFLFWNPKATLDLPLALPIIEENNPYRGLEVYEEVHKELFFGRKDAAERLAAAVQKEPLVIVVGASGTGKSSLVRAGLLPKLSQEQPLKWIAMPPLRPGSRPLAALAQLAQQISSKRSDLTEAVRHFCTIHPDQKLLLIIDQLEELVTVGKDEHAEFLSALQAAREAGGNLIHIVATLRSEFEPHFSDLLKSDAGKAPRFLVPHMSRENLRHAIEEPARQRVLFFEPAGLVDKLIDEVIDMPGALPLLSFTMSEMYRIYARRHVEARHNRLLTEAYYKELGEVAGALSKRAEEVFASLDSAEKQTLQNLMLRMVVPGEAARRRVYESELRFPEVEQERVNRVKQTLLDARLIVSGQDDDGKVYVEPAHDKLILGWQRLEQLRTDDRCHQLHHRLIDSVQSWEGSGEADFLWDRDPRLPQALALLRSSPNRFNRQEARFLSESRDRRYLVRAALAVAGLVVLAILGGWFKRELDSAQKIKRQSEELAKQRDDLKQTNSDLEKKNAQIEQQLSEIQKQKAVIVKDGEEIKQTTAEIKQQKLYAEVETGRQLLFESRNPSEALLWLNRALEHGSSHPDLPGLLRRAQQNVRRLYAVLDSPSSIYSAMYSPDGRRIVTAHWDGIARIWDTESDHQLAELRGHTNRVASAAYSPDGLHIVTASWDKTARVWDAKSGRQLQELKGHDSFVIGASYSPDGQYILTASRDRAARLWDAKTGQLVSTTPGGGVLVSANYSPDGQRIVTSAMLSHVANVGEVRSGKVLITLQGHTGQIEHASYSPDGRCILTASSDRTAKIWNAQSGQLLAHLGGHSASLMSAAYSPSGLSIVTASMDRTARIWDARKGAFMVELTGHNDLVSSASFSPDERRVVTASRDCTARVWDAQPGGALSQALKDTGTVNRSAEYSRDGRRILNFRIDQAGPDWAQVWDAKSGKLIMQIEIGKSFMEGAMSADGSRIVTASSAGTLRLSDVSSGKVLFELKGPPLSIPSRGEFSPDGRLLLATGEGAVQLWNVKSGRAVATLKGEAKSRLFASFSPDSRTVVTTGIGMPARIWDAQSGRLLAELKAGGFGSNIAAYAPDLRCIAIASHGSPTKIWDLEAKSLLVELKGESITPESMLFSPDGLQLATFNGYNRAQLWHAASGRLLAELKGYHGRINRLVYSRDGRRIATAHNDGTARVWDAKTGRLCAEVRGSYSDILSVSFSPDGRRLLTAGLEDLVRTWDISEDPLDRDQLTKFIRCNLSVRFPSEDSSVVEPFIPNLPQCRGRQPAPKEEAAHAQPKAP